jgi:hypothetical protein
MYSLRFCDRTSINQFITLALAEKIAALMTEEYLEERAQRGDRAKVSSQKVGANPCGCPPGQVQDLPLPQVIEKIRTKFEKAMAKVADVEPEEEDKL